MKTPRKRSPVGQRLEDRNLFAGDVLMAPMVHEPIIDESAVERVGARGTAINGVPNGVDGFSVAERNAMNGFQTGVDGFAVAERNAMNGFQNGGVCGPHGLDTPQDRLKADVVDQVIASPHWLNDLYEELTVKPIRLT